jgi:hypothetical protein
LTVEDEIELRIMRLKIATYSDLNRDKVYDEETLKTALKNMVNDARIIKKGDSYSTYL